MDLNQELNQLYEDQKKIIQGYEKLIQNTEGSRIAAENEKLKTLLSENAKSLEIIQSKYKAVSEENQQLRISLQEQIIHEKLNILKISEKKLRLYFKNEQNTSVNALKACEENFQKEIKEISIIAQNELKNENEYFLNEIKNLKLQLVEKIRDSEERLRQEEAKLFKTIREDYEVFNQEGMDEKTIEKRIRQNKIEMKIGLNWINKIGLLLILIGIGVAAKHGYGLVNHHMKGILFYLLGIVFLFGGELVYRRKKDAFAVGLLGGGISILYASTFYSYFMLKIISIETGIILSVVITLVSIVLAIRYNRAAILSFGLVGGYFPFLSYVFNFGFSGADFYIGMGYLLMLNLIVLFISFYKEWRVLNFVSFSLNVPSLIYLVLNVDIPLVGLAYALLTFFMYLSVILAYPLRNKISLKNSDLILLAFNTSASAVVVYLLFDKMQLNFLQGYLALVFCLVYFGLGHFMKKVMGHESKSILLFYLTSLTFAVLMVPFQFGAAWLSTGWLVEGVLLLVYGYKRGFKQIETAGFIIFSLCIGVFIFYDCSLYSISQSLVPFFDFKYLFVTLGGLLAVTVYQLDLKNNRLSEFSKKGKTVQVFKYIVLMNAYLFLLFISFKHYDTYTKDMVQYRDFVVFYKNMILSVISMGAAFFLTRVRLFSDKFLDKAALGLFFLADLVFIVILLGHPLAVPLEMPFFFYFSMVLLLVYNVLVILNLRSILLKFFVEQNKNLEFFPLTMSVIFMGIITGWLTIQFDLQNVNLILSFSYLGLAIGCIVYGFWKKFLYIRFFGLGLTLLALIKLFFYDLSYLETGGKIVAYFGFGVLLLLISYIYQKINHKMNQENQNETH
ncbi:MAG TPA: DUF2339 domain-containing protein [Spirochaetia bacterium]|nr:MAG: hypothetical protein A2Y41_11215 [Spirochaetes bacterium GWB1_36_13]HCL56174.1 DUF2339 domain-containing protein [Spirochaetia bacterium]